MVAARYCKLEKWRNPDGSWVWKRRYGVSYRFVAVRRDGWVLGTTYYSLASAMSALWKDRKDRAEHEVSKH